MTTTGSATDDPGDDSSGPALPAPELSAPGIGRSLCCAEDAGVEVMAVIPLYTGNDLVIDELVVVSAGGERLTETYVVPDFTPGFLVTDPPTEGEATAAGYADPEGFELSAGAGGVVGVAGVLPTDRTEARFSLTHTFVDSGVSSQIESHVVASDCD